MGSVIATKAAFSNKTVIGLRREISEFFTYQNGTTSKDKTEKKVKFSYTRCQNGKSIASTELMSC